jgi:HD-GYP domain-containing protein (c-di-GMP phosphodiesterase class II)
VIQVAVIDLKPGMRLGTGVRDAEGRLLLGPGVALNWEYIGRLRDRGFPAVWVEDENTTDILPEENLTEVTRVRAMGAIREAFAMTSEVGGALKTESAEEIRKTLRSERFKKILQEHPAVERLFAEVDKVVNEVLHRDVLTGLNSIRSRDAYTYHHCLDMTVTAIMIAQRLDFSRDRLQKLAVGCILHDIGKIFVDDEVLNKQGPLTPEEFKRMKDHTVLGYILLKENLRLGVLPPHIAFQHHERQDGTGYPRGLKGSNRIPPPGRMVYAPGKITLMGEIAAIADFHDACCSDRPYRRGFPPDRVWNMIRERAGTHFNKEIVDVFLSVLPVYPVGVQVIVTDGPHQGYRGVVTKVDPTALDLPVVRLLYDSRGRRIDPFEVDLRRDDATGIRCMVREDPMLALAEPDARD